MSQKCQWHGFLCRWFIYNTTAVILKCHDFGPISIIFCCLTVCYYIHVDDGCSKSLPKITRKR